MIESVDQAFKAASNGKVQDRTYSKSLGGTLSTTDPPYHLWTFGGQPGAGSYSGTKEATQVTKATAGALGFVNPSSPDVLHLQSIAGRALSTTVSQSATVTLIVIDHLVHYAGIDATSGTEQSLDNGDGLVLPRYQDGYDVMMMAVAQTNVGTGTPTATVDFLDENGDAQQTTFTLANVNAGRICHGSDYFIPLGGSVRGVQSVLGVTLSAGASAGTFAIVLFKVIAKVSLARGWLTKSFLFGDSKVLPRIYDDAALDAIVINDGFASLANFGVSADLCALEG